MSNAGEQYQDADRLARAVEEENRRRQEVRGTEMDRLKRLHAEEVAEEQAVSQYARAMRAVRQHQLRQEPEQVRRSLTRFSTGFVLISAVGSMMVWLYAAELLAQQGLPGWVGHVVGAGYALSFLGALAWHARACWSPGAQSRLPAAVAGSLALLPVPFFLAAAWAGWTNWLAVIVVLVVFFVLSIPGIGACRELSRQYQQIRAAKERAESSP